MRWFVERHLDHTRDLSIVLFRVLQSDRVELSYSALHISGEGEKGGGEKKTKRRIRMYLPDERERQGGGIIKRDGPSFILRPHMYTY